MLLDAISRAFLPAMSVQLVFSLANSYIALQQWPHHFKESVSIITKAFWPIVLLYMLGKLIEKMIAR